MIPERGRKPDEEPTPLTIADISERAREILLRNGQHPPAVIVDGEQRTIVVHLVGVPPTHSHRLAQMFAAGFHLAKRAQMGKLRQVFHVTEAWLSRVQPGEELPARPSEDPQRQEVLIIAQLDFVKRAVQLITYEMLRDASGQLIELRETDLGVTVGEPGDAPLLVAFVAGCHEAQSEDRPH